jgi:hypothetical protein
MASRRWQGSRCLLGFCLCMPWWSWPCPLWRLSAWRFRLRSSPIRACRRGMSSPCVRPRPGWCDQPPGIPCRPSMAWRPWPPRTPWWCPDTCRWMTQASRCARHCAGPLPRRADGLGVHRRLRTCRGGPARSPPGDHALAVRRPARRPASGGESRPGRAVGRRGSGADQRRAGRRHRPVRASRACPPSRCGATTIRRATLTAASLP